MSDHLVDMVAPSELGSTEIINRALKVIAGCIDAAQHDLVSEHQPANQFRTPNVDRPIASWQAGEHVRAVVCQRIQQVELERSNARGIDNQVELSHIVTKASGVCLASIDVLSADSLEPS
jgi:hypothetical protein